jgi:hypothetical protein
MAVECAYNFKEVCHLENLGVDERIILKCTLKKEARRMWTGLIGLRRGASGGTLLKRYCLLCFI